MTEKEIDVLQLQKQSSPVFLLFGVNLIQGCNQNPEDKKTYIMSLLMKSTLHCDAERKESYIILNHWSLDHNDDFIDDDVDSYERNDDEEDVDV